VRVPCSVKQTSKGLAWCKVLSKDKVRVPSKRARDKVVRVYITSKRLVWWGRVFEIEFQFQLVLSLVLGAMQG
jgi:hypothetical protein